jgi:ankyrin repeat protein
LGLRHRENCHHLKIHGVKSNDFRRLDISRIYLKLENISLVSAPYIPEQLREPSPDTRLLQAAPQALSDLAVELSASGILEQPILLKSTDDNLAESTESLVKGLEILTMGDATIASSPTSSSIEEVPRSPGTPDSMTAFSSGRFELDEKQVFDTMSFDSGIGMSDDGTQSNKEMQISSPFSAQSPDDNPFTNIRGVRVAVSQLLEDRCSKWCSCLCHQRRHIRSPAKLNRLLGSLFVGYTSLPFLSPACNEKRCKKRSSPSIRVNYYFPNWFMMRALVFAATQNANSPEMLLKVIRMVPPNSEIFYYAETGNVAGMSDLFRRGLASPRDVEYGTGVSALHKAVDWRQMDTVQLLLSAGADPFLEDQNGWTAADTVCQLAFHNSTEHRRVFGHLIRTLDLDFENLQFSVLHKIVLKLVSLDLEQQLEVSTADIDVPDSSGQTPLFWAANQGDRESVRILLKHGANPNIISVLGEVPLHWSIEAIPDDCTRLLLENGAMPNVRSIFGTSPLHYAVWTHEDPANHMQPLVEHGANVNLQNRKGRAPLHYALSKDWVKPVAFLLNHGAQIETADEDGVTPLAEAVKMDLPNVTSLLINRGANILVRDRKDNSILHVAAANAGLETFASLAQHDLFDLEVDSLNTAGETASSLVRSRHDKTEDLVAAFDALVEAILTQQAQLEEESEVFEDAVEFLDTG